MHSHRRLFFAIAISLAAITSAHSEPFYAGKTLNALVGGKAGSNTDLNARIIIRHMEKHIAGQPRIIVRNLKSGSGGIVSINYIGEVAPKDGTALLIGTVSYPSQLLDDPALRVKYSDLEVVGGLGMQGVVNIRKDMPPGIHKVSDLFKVTQPIKAAGYRAGHAVDLHFQLTMTMLKLPYKMVTGFRNASGMHRAELQNEVQMGFDSTVGYRQSVVPTLIKPGIAIPLWHTGIPTENGGLAPSPSFPDIPTFLDVYKMKFGKNAMPPQKLWAAYRLITRVRASMLRGIFLPPTAPHDALVALRAAWAATAKDPGFLKDFRKAYRTDPDVTLGADGARYLKNGAHADPTVVALLKKLASEE